MALTGVYLNRIGAAHPANDVHHAFVGFAERQISDPRISRVFHRMADRGQIEHRWSTLAPSVVGPADFVDADGFYRFGSFPSTAERMRRYEAAAPGLAAAAVEKLELGDEADLTHLIVVSCTGLSAPGLDFDLIRRFGLNPSIERTVVGFMGCYAAINGLKLARHIVRSEPKAKVLMICLELCTLHLKETDDLEQILSFLVFGDGCAAALVSAEPSGLALDGFHAAMAPDTSGHITWTIRDLGFDMVLSGRVPGEISRALKSGTDRILAGRNVRDIDLWAVHPGGRSVLDAVEEGLELPADALSASREVLRANGNMSSATILFVLADMMRDAPPDQTGCAMAFGPGLVAETMTFRTVG
jgi:predicted naringenin-chalcone synthase